MHRFDESANDAINHAFSEARHMNDLYVGTEHLLLGLSMLKKSGVRKTFSYYQVTDEDIREAIETAHSPSEKGAGILGYSEDAEACLERSAAYAAESDSGEILPEHLLLAILEDKACKGFRVFARLSLNPLKFMDGAQEDGRMPAPKQASKRGISGILRPEALSGVTVQAVDFHAEESAAQMDFLETVGYDVFERSGAMDIVGRQSEIERLIQILSRRSKNSPCLIGDPGVGKSAIIVGLAQRLAQGDVPETLRGKRILAVYPDALVAGTMYRGQFEARMRQLIDILEAPSDYIALFDDLHSWVGMGATGEKSSDVLTMLSPYLETGRIAIIGTTTHEAFKKYLEPNAALLRRMTQVPIKPPTQEETRSILRRAQSAYERHHNVIIDESAIDRAIALADRYLKTRQFPDKALDILDEACARKQLEHFDTREVVKTLKYTLEQLNSEKTDLILDRQFEAASDVARAQKRILDHVNQNVKAKEWMRAQKPVISASDIDPIVSQWAQVPVEQLTEAGRHALSAVDQTLSEWVIGQPAAVSSVARALKRFRVGLSRPDHPVGSFLFVGPTGVGKTELARAVADVFFGGDAHLIKLDMTEFTERHSVSKLIGSPPGYQGVREGGMLTNAIAKHPYSVVLFDEIEKAHYEVIQILLQMMDEGRLRDGAGQTYDFRNALIVMTSNLGAGDTLNRSIGFVQSRPSNWEEKLREACLEYFSAEFVNRMDEIIVFTELTREATHEIVALHLKRLADQLAEQDIVLTCDETAIERLAELGYSATYGARPIRRVIDKWVRDPLADALLESVSRRQFQLTVNDAGDCVLEGDENG